MENMIDKEKFGALVKEKGYHYDKKECEKVVGEYLNEVLFKIVKQSQLQAEHSKHKKISKSDAEIGVEMTRELSFSKK